MPCSPNTKYHVPTSTLAHMLANQDDQTSKLLIVWGQTEVLITFVNFPANVQLFESKCRLDIAVQAMKQKALKTKLRVRVFKTPWAWWIDNESPEKNPSSYLSLPITYHQPTRPV
ncbi:hypothetical protein PTTG_02121, partial [Puccinia triticina 1-1 BBBD Race 1]